MVVFRWHEKGRILLVICWVCAGITRINAGGGFNDPYRVLGVSRNAPRKEIQKRYRKLCLQYHPDKNVNKSQKEQEKCESRFKEVQEAYDMIQNPSSSFPGYQHGQPSGQSGNPFAGSPTAEAFFQAFGGKNNNFFFYKTGPYGPGFGVRTPFPQQGSSWGMPAQLQAFKSIYVQTVKIPLEDLYNGIQSVRFELKDNIFTRYQAAIRGKSIYVSLMLSSYVSFPVLRVSKFLAAVLGIYTFHTTLPKPDPKASYVTSLRKGTRGGKTNVKFASSSSDQPEIIFAIEEDAHPVYRRQDNNLLAEVTITSDQARKGCTMTLDPLDPNEPKIQIKIPPKKYSYQTQRGKASAASSSERNVITVRGRGWPIRNAHRSDNHPDVYLHGDLLVTVTVSKPSSKQQGTNGRRRRQRR